MVSISDVTSHYSLLRIGSSQKPNYNWDFNIFLTHGVYFVLNWYSVVTSLKQKPMEIISLHPVVVQINDKNILFRQHTTNLMYYNMPSRHVYAASSHH
jgi:hypothetical protein